MLVSLAAPEIKFLPSYLEALREGSFSPMQLGRGTLCAEKIEKAPQRYIDWVRDTKPFSITLAGMPQTVFEHEILWIVSDAFFIGALSFRYRADEEIIKRSGHLGMALRPGLIGKGWGGRLVYRFYQTMANRFLDHKITEISATCYDDNHASQHLIEHLGGRLVDRLTLPEEGRTRLRFCIDFAAYQATLARHRTRIGNATRPQQSEP